MTYTIKQGDVLEVTRGYPDNHFDGLFCDPPYGLEFMGKDWDKFGVTKARAKRLTGLEKKRDAQKYDYLIGKGRYSEMSVEEKASFQEFIYQWAKEALRILKPGAFGLVFGGTRTWHRLACALEDAGFEMRNGEFQPIFWIYGSGFPKSFDISKGIDKAAGAEREVVGKYQHPDGSGERSAKGLPIINTATPRKENGEWNYNSTAPATPEAKHWQGYGTGLKPSWEPVLIIRKPLEPVTSKELRELTGWDFWHNPTFVTNTIKRRLKILKRYGVRLPSGWLEVKITKISRKALHEKVESDVLFTVEALRQWRGNPTPSELLARVDVKRYRAWRTDTNTADALKWNCGGLNIDGGRIGLTGECNLDAKQRQHKSEGIVKFGAPGLIGKEIPTYKPQGRWPANLILAHKEGCKCIGTRRVKTGTTYEQPKGQTEGRGIFGPPSLGRITGYADTDGKEEMEVWECEPDCPIAMLDAQSGESKSTGGTGETTQSIGGRGKYSGGDNRGFFYYGDSGGASRFFYCAKASRTERNAGLEGFEDKHTAFNSAGYGNGEPSIQRNHHPTVKPLDLCRYLAKLILPPEREGDPRRLSVPFCGSGSEIIGALQAGWDEVDGIDIDPEYCKIAEARLTYWCKREREKIPF